MRRFLDFWFEIEFYLKIAIACTIFQQLFYWVLSDIQLDFITQVLLYWIVGSVSFYGIGFLIENYIKKQDNWVENLNVRTRKVKKQPYPAFTLKGIILGEIKSLITIVIILAIAPEVHRGNGLMLNMGWFLMRIAAADFCFYVAHWLFHQKSLQKIHLKHHEFSDTSSFVAGHKSLTEYIIVTITDLLPIFIFGYDITQILAWSLIGNAYNLEGHSSLSIFFISSNFHDIHHTNFKGNYGIGGFWDRIFNTLNPSTQMKRS